MTDTYGKRVKVLREGQGWSQSDLAEMVNRNRPGWNWQQTTVGKIERDARSLQLAEAVALAEVFHLGLEDIARTGASWGLPLVEETPDDTFADFVHGKVYTRTAASGPGPEYPTWDADDTDTAPPLPDPERIEFLLSMIAPEKQGLDPADVRRVVTDNVRLQARMSKVRMVEWDIQRHTARLHELNAERDAELQAIDSAAANWPKLEPTWDWDDDEEEDR